MRLSLEGRRQTLDRVRERLDPTRPVCWMHAASLGEYEMGIPVLEEFLSRHPHYQIVITFFSPSGYEVISRKESGYLIAYLPWDRLGPMREFVGLIRPRIALFVKYEVWPVCMEVIKEYRVPAFLLSALFREKQAYFAWFGVLPRYALRGFDHIFVRNEASLPLLREIGIKEVSVCGDTRFERVTQTLGKLDPQPLIRDFLEGSRLSIVAGSTWPEDERIVLSWLKEQEAGIKLILAPHEVDPLHIEEIREQLNLPYLMYSELEVLPASERIRKLRQARALIIDTIGLLRKLYRYAEVSYIGGGYSGKLHNTLEPAVFGIPIVIGPRYEKFPEAVDMERRKGLFPTGGREEFSLIMSRFLREPSFRESSGERNAEYVRENLGATEKIVALIEKYLK